MISHDLRIARRLILNPENWTKGAFTRSERDGRERHCILAVLGHVTRDEKGQYPNPRYRAARAAVSNVIQIPDQPYIDMLSWHDADERTHSEVIAALDLAIAQTTLKGE